MSNHDPKAPVPSGDDDGGFEGPDVEKAVSERPFVDTHGELDDSADSYVSPARDHPRDESDAVEDKQG